MAGQQILIAGCGDVGTALGLVLAARGDRVWGLRRDPSSLPAVIHPVSADLTDPSTLRTLPAGLDAVVYAAAAGGRDDARYRAIYVDGVRNVIDALVAGGQAPARLLFTSSTGVYGQTDGGWVDEAASTEPTGFSGRRVLEGEQLVRATPWPSTVVRLGGIYGPGRTFLLRLARTGAPLPPASAAPRYTNRIHRDDAAGLLAHVLGSTELPGVLNGVDDDPAPYDEVLTWICHHAGWPPPPRDAAATVAGRGGNKRVANRALHACGYALRYPSYREGYAALLGSAAVD